MDMEPKEDECLWEINLLVMSIDQLNSNTITNVEGEWSIHKDLDLAYFPAFAYDYVPLDTSTDVDSDPWSAMNALTSLCAPIKLSLLVRAKRLEVHTMLSLKYQPSKKSQKLIQFGRIETEPMAYESSGGNSESSQFFHYGQKSCHMMERMGYDHTKGSGLNVSKRK